MLGKRWRLCWFDSMCQQQTGYIHTLHVSKLLLWPNSPCLCLRMCVCLCLSDSVLTAGPCLACVCLPAFVGARLSCAGQLLQRCKCELLFCLFNQSASLQLSLPDKTRVSQHRAASATHLDWETERECERPEGLFLSLVQCDESGRQPIRRDDEPTGNNVWVS